MCLIPPTGRTRIEPGAPHYRGGGSARARRRFSARRGKDIDLEQWTVGGRGFGARFVFPLMAGEIYTTFTFLGGSGFAYGKGGPGLLHSLLRHARICHLIL